MTDKDHKESKDYSVEQAIDWAKWNKDAPWADFRKNYRHGRIVITPAMAANMSCPFSRSEDEL